MKLSLSSDIRKLANEIVAPLLNPELWKTMGLSYAKNPYAIIRMEGVTGVGKTALANYMARKLKQAPMHLDFAKVAGEHIGQTEGAINAFFDAANETKTKTVILEECDALVWSRDQVTKDTVHQLGFVSELLRRIDEFKNRDMPSMLILTTNHPDRMDAAVESRVTDVIEIPLPAGDHAAAMWIAKLPQCILDTANSAQIGMLAELKYTPRMMETRIIKVCRRAAVEGRLPTYTDMWGSK